MNDFNLVYFYKKRIEDVVNIFKMFIFMFGFSLEILREEEYWDWVKFGLLVIGFKII